MKFYGSERGFEISSSRSTAFSDTHVSEGFRVLDKFGNAVENGSRGLLTYNRGTVCDDGFGDTEANAICIEMGFVRSSEWDNGYLFSSLQDSLEINLDEVNCDNEDWSSCSYSEEHNCGHSEDVFISCSSDTVPGIYYFITLSTFVLIINT